MTKISLALATALLLASASSNVAFAAITSTRTALAEGQAVNDCRAQEVPDRNASEHHEHLAVQACVARMMHVNESNIY